jgi:glycosyltransferase involved in cell wall biosynthesis
VVLLEPAADRFSYESKFLPLLANHLDPELFYPYVVGSTGLANRLEPSRYRVFELPLGYLGHRGSTRFLLYAVSLLLSSLYLIKAIKASQTRILLSMAGHCYSGFVIALVGKLTMRRSIIRISEPTRALLKHNHRPFLAYALATWTEKLSLSLCTAAFSVRDMSDYFGYNVKKAHVISQGVNIQEIEKAEKVSLPKSFEPAIVSVSRLDSEKGIDRIIDSMKYLVPSYPNIGCFIVGWGPEFKNLARRVSDAALDNYVEFVGYVPPAGIASFLKACDIFILPSELEGVPSAVLEAMASGLPVVMCTRSGSFVESVSKANAGLIVSAQPKAIAEAVTVLLSNTYLRETVAKRGASYVREYYDCRDSQEKMNGLIMSLYDS